VAGRHSFRAVRSWSLRLSSLKDSDLVWVNGKSGRQSWCYADAFKRSIISEVIYHLRGEGLVRLIGAVVCLLCCAAGPLVRYRGQCMAAYRAMVSSAHANQLPLPGLWSAAVRVNHLLAALNQVSRLYLFLPFFTIFIRESRVSQQPRDRAFTCVNDQLSTVVQFYVCCIGVRSYADDRR